MFVKHLAWDNTIPFVELQNLGLIRPNLGLSSFGLWTGRDLYYMPHLRWHRASVFTATLAVTQGLSINCHTCGDTGPQYLLPHLRWHRASVFTATPAVTQGLSIYCHTCSDTRPQYLLPHLQWHRALVFTATPAVTQGLSITATHAVKQGLSPKDLANLVTFYG